MTRRRALVFAALVACIAIVASTCVVAEPAAAQSAGPVAFTEQRDLVYRTIDGRDLHLDAFVPSVGSTTRRPAVVFVHGGGWAGGVKESMEDEARWAAGLGFVAFSVQYRLAPDDPYPAAVDDVRAAVRWLRAPEQASTFGLDPKRIGALGASAGGHLVAMLATTGSGSLTRGSRVRAAVSWSGIMDMTRESDTYSAIRYTPTVAGFLQCTHDDPACAERQRAASPLTHIDRTDAPMLLVNTEEEIVPPDQARVMSVALSRVRVPNRLVVLPGDAHAQSYRDTQWPDAVAFLERYVGKPPPVAE
jgi:acetyl esterase/lipase